MNSSDDQNNHSNGMIQFPEIKAALERISSGGIATTPSMNAKTILRFWLWGCNANEVCDRGKCDFHEMHLVAMVCARVFIEAYHDTDDTFDTVPVVIDNDDIVTQSNVQSFYHTSTGRMR